MAFGTFTLTGHFEGLTGIPASGKVRIDGNPQVITDTAGHKVRVGPRTVMLDSGGNFSIALPSDATTGNSTGIAYRVTTDLKGLANITPPLNFYARPMSATVDLADLVNVAIVELGNAPTGPPGPAGPQGPPGPASTVPGPQGVTGSPGVSGLTQGTLDDEVFGITDASSRKSWLAIGADGGPPDRVKAILQAIIQSGLGFTATKSEALGRAYNITDAAGREAFWIDETGALGWQKLTSSTIARLVDALTVSGYTSVPTFYKGPLGAQHRMASGPNVICWGDSLTAGAGSSTIPAGSTVTAATTYPQRVQALLDARLGSGVASVANAGVGGETSVSIAARANAAPLLATVAGGSIPASGPVTITLVPINGSTPRPLLQGDGGGTTGTLWVKGVPVLGTLGIVQPGGASSTFNAGTDSYTFTRATAGTAITADRTHSFTYDFADLHRDDIHLIWVGQNGPSDTRARTDAAAIIQRMSALDKRFLVMARPTNNDTDDSAWHDLYARRYVAVRAHLVQYGLAEAGLTATSQDNTDIAAGTIPTSLRSDGVHFNAAGYHILGTLVYNRLVELGWV